jgi:alpha-L-fucosidase
MSACYPIRSRYAPDMSPSPLRCAPHHAWFDEARFGIFLHWGIYSVGQYEASWAFFNHGVKGQDPRDSLPHDQYMAQRHAFLARRYESEAWLDAFKDAGARYTVLTAKHHDGVALWDTAEGLSTVRDCGAGRDLLAPFCAATRRAGLNLGIYYSHLDWNHPDYASQPKPPGGFTDPHPGHRYSFAEQEDTARWERFLHFHRLQLRELCQRFSPDLLWFDGDWERTPQQWRFSELRKQLLEWRPDVLLNSRMGDQGDYATPEQAIPMSPPPGPWELCMTMNRSWSMALDQSYKTPQELIRLLAECAGMGGNLLLNVSPLSDGTLWHQQVGLLREIGTWLRRNGEAIYGTQAGLPAGHWYGPSTLSKDRTTLYLTVLDRPSGEVAVKGIRNRIRSATLLGDGGHQIPQRVSGGAPWMKVPGVLWLGVPASAVDASGSVIKLELEGPLDLYTGHGAVVTQN